MGQRPPGRHSFCIIPPSSCQPARNSTYWGLVKVLPVILTVIVKKIVVVITRAIIAVRRSNSNSNITRKLLTGGSVSRRGIVLEISYSSQMCSIVASKIGAAALYPEVVLGRQAPMKALIWLQGWQETTAHIHIGPRCCLHRMLIHDIMLALSLSLPGSVPLYVCVYVLIHA